MQYNVWERSRLVWLYLDMLESRRVVMIPVRVLIDTCSNIQCCSSKARKRHVSFPLHHTKPIQRRLGDLVVRRPTT